MSEHAMTHDLVGSFDALLRDKIAELDADESPSALVIDNDPVERLRLDARQQVFSTQTGPLQRSGHGAYVAPVDPPPDVPSQRHLNIVF